MSRSIWHLLRSRLIRAAADDPTSDAALLHRYRTARDETAFELLVWRHAAVVLGVCRRILKDEHATEDAFQATFLILARKAGTIRRTDALAGWLHRVARRVAVRAARTQPRPAPLPADLPAPDVATPELSHLDAAIDRLPDRLRLPVVYCYLQQMTTEQAAVALGIPRGTVLSRLSKARQLLAARLAGGVAVLAVVEQSAAASNALVAATISFAHDSAATGRAVLLSEAVMMGMRLRRVAGWTVAMIVGVGVATGVGVTFTRPVQADVPVAPRADPDPPATTNPPVTLRDTIAERSNLHNRIQVLSRRAADLQRELGQSQQDQEGPEERYRRKLAALQLSEKLAQQMQTAQLEIAMRQHYLASGWQPTAEACAERAELHPAVKTARGELNQAKEALAKLKANGATPPEQIQAAEALVAAKDKRLGEHLAVNIQVARKALEEHVEYRNRVKWAERGVRKYQVELDESSAAYDAARRELDNIEIDAFRDTNLTRIRSELKIVTEMRGMLLKRQLELEFTPTPDTK